MLNFLLFLEYFGILLFFLYLVYRPSIYETERLLNVTFKYYGDIYLNKQMRTRYIL